MENSFDGIVLIIPNFINKEECNSLKNWALDSYNKNGFVPGVSRNKEGKVERVTFRWTNRMSHNIHYPSLVYEIQQKIRNTLKLDNSIIEGHGKDGVVVSITFNDGDVYPHRDPPVTEGLSGLRCNILASKAETGGIIYVNNKPYNPDIGDLMCYLVTDYEHRVETCNGSTPRIMFMFGSCIESSNWENSYFNPSPSYHPDLVITPLVKNVAGAKENKI